MVYGATGAGLTATGSQLWSQESPGVAGTAEGLDRFGAALASGDDNGDGRADLVIGAPGENASSGVVHVLYGSAAGLTATGSELWSQDSPGIDGIAEQGDFFGDPLAAGTLTRAKAGQPAHEPRQARRGLRQHPEPTLFLHEIMSSSQESKHRWRRRVSRPN